MVCCNGWKWRESLFYRGNLSSWFWTNCPGVGTAIGAAVGGVGGSILGNELGVNIGLKMFDEIKK